MAGTTTSTLQRVRRFLLLGFLAIVAAIVTLYLFGRERPGGPSTVDDDQTPAGEVVQIGTGFHRFEVTEDGEKLFEIQADRILSHESDLYVLEGVQITMVRDDDSTYTITADSGSYTITRNEASLSGDVEIASSDGLSLKTEGLELRQRGKVVVSSAPVQISLGGLYFGRANRLEFLFPANRLSLAGKVELGTVPGSFPSASLRAQRTVFFRDTHNFLAEGNVQLRRGADQLRARRLSINLDDADRKILFALASWGVEATLAQVDAQGMPSNARVEGDQLSVVFNETTGDPERLEIDAPDGGTARLIVVDATQMQRGLVADYLWANFSGGRIEQAQGLGGVILEEGFRFAPRTLLRRICSDSVDVSYDRTGSLTTLKLEGAVSYDEPSLQASGDELTAQGDSGTVDLIGESAWVATPEGRLEAPRIHLDRAEGRAEATDGVRAEMASRSSPDLSGETEVEEPVRVEAERAEWTGEPQSFRFQGNVRAWQQENFLVCQTLALEGDEMRAEGGVRSVWRQRSEDLVATEPPPITLSANKMRYNLDEGRIVYDGNSQIVQGGRSMRCPRLQLEVNEDNDFERMYCEGGSQIVDADGGSTISGDAAIYHTDAGKVKVVGDPVRLSQSGGGTINARLMVYDFATAIAEIDSVKDEVADLFMSSSEYFKQFSFVQNAGVTAPVGTPPGAPTTPAVDPVTGLPVPPTTVDPVTGLPVQPAVDPVTGLPATPTIDPATGLPVVPEDETGTDETSAGETEADEATVEGEDEDDGDAVEAPADEDDSGGARR